MNREVGSSIDSSYSSFPFPPCGVGINDFDWPDHECTKGLDRSLRLENRVDLSE
jgi:hypothetical protein